MKWSRVAPHQRFSSCGSVMQPHKVIHAMTAGSLITLRPARDRVCLAFGLLMEAHEVSGGLLLLQWLDLRLRLLYYWVA